MRRVSGGRLTATNCASAVILLVEVIVACYGIVLPFFPAEAFLQYRVLGSFAFLSGGVVSAALVLSAGWARKAVAVVGAGVVYVLVLDIAIAHQYLFVQNEIDRTTTLAIADRLKSDPDYRPFYPWSSSASFRRMWRTRSRVRSRS